MTRIHTIRIIRRMACAMAGLAGALLALSFTASAAFAYDLPPSGGAGAATAAAHTAAIGGMPGWQITLIAIAAAVLGAALAVIADRFLAARRRVSARAA